MEWENCVRCGSNRVIKRQTILFPLLVVLAGIVYANLGLYLMVESIIFGIMLSLFGVLCAYFGMKWMTKSKRLYCKDCEVTWKPEIKKIS